MSTGRKQTWEPGCIAVLDCLVRPGGPELSAEARLVYLALFSYWGSNDVIKPSVDTIAVGVGLHRATVLRKLVELESAGLISRTTKGRHNYYGLTPPWQQSQTTTSRTEQPVAGGDQSQTATSRSVRLTPVAESDHNQSQGATLSNPSSNPSEVTHISSSPVDEVGLPAGGEDGSTVPARKSAKKTDGDGYSPEFEAFWLAYPRRQEKAKAWRVWLARMSGKSGVKAEPAQLILAAEHYARAMNDEEREQKHIKHAATFLGPDDHWQEYLQPPTAAPQTAGRPGRQYRDHNQHQSAVPDVWKRKGATA